MSKEGWKHVVMNEQVIVAKPKGGTLIYSDDAMQLVPIELATEWLEQGKAREPGQPRPPEAGPKAGEKVAKKVEHDPPPPVMVRKPRVEIEEPKPVEPKQPKIEIDPVKE